MVEGPSLKDHASTLDDQLKTLPRFVAGSTNRRADVSKNKLT